MAVETDADRAIFTDARDFGSTVTWTSAGGSADVPAIFDAEYMLLASELVDGGIEGSGPTLTMRLADVPSDAAHGDMVTVGGADFKVVEFKPDGTGMTAVRLQEV